MRLRHVVVANMTGNVAVLGFVIAGAQGISVSASLVTLLRYLAESGAACRLHSLFETADVTRAPLGRSTLRLPSVPHRMFRTTRAWSGDRPVRRPGARRRGLVSGTWRNPCRR